MVRAQDQGQSQSAGTIPAYHSPLAGIAAGADTNADQNSDQSQPRNQPLSGVQPLSLGMETTRSYWQPRFDVFGTADSNPQQIGEVQNWTTWISGSGGVDIHRITGISDLSVGYTAGGIYSNGYTSGNGIVQGLNLADKLSFRRSTISFFDHATYLPESAFGFGGVGGAGLPGGGLGTPGLAFNPGQTILTGSSGQMLNNADAVELDELLTPRSSVTISGGYSLLHYFGAGSDLLNYGVVNARGGYNYQISRNNTMAVLYTFGDYRYDISGQSMIDHGLQLSYGRVITGKLAFQVAGGPLAVFSTFAPAISSGGSSTTSLASDSQVLWSLNTSLEYQERRYGMGLSYAHGVNGGSGVLLGSEMDTVTGSLTRQMSRTFSSGVSGGYSRNQGLSGEDAFANQSYRYWFGGLSLTAPLGQTFGLTLSYQVQYQTSNAAACIGPTCGQNVLRNMISVGLGWHERPLLF